MQPSKLHNANWCCSWRRIRNRRSMTSPWVPSSTGWSGLTPSSLVPGWAGMKWSTMLSLRSAHSHIHFPAGRFGLFLLACLLQAYIAAHICVASCSCCLTMVVMIVSSYVLWIKKSTACWQLPAVFLETTRSEYNTMQLHFVC